MYCEVDLFYSEERKTWNVFVEGELYYESEDYDQAETVYFNCVTGEDY